jgi:capsular polysaccharide biosynthesis protein
MTPAFHDLSKQLKHWRILIISVALVVATAQAFIIRSVKGEYQTHSKIFPLSINKGGASSPIDAIKMQFGISDKTDYEKIYNVTELVTSKTISSRIVHSPSPNK